MRRAVKKANVDPRPAPKRAVKKPSVDPRRKRPPRRPSQDVSRLGATMAGSRSGPRGPSQDISKLAATMAGRRGGRSTTGGTRKRVAGLSDSMNQKLAAQRRNANRARPASRRRARPVARPARRPIRRAIRRR